MSLPISFMRRVVRARRSGVRRNDAAAASRSSGSFRRQLVYLACFGSVASACSSAPDADAALEAWAAAYNSHAPGNVVSLYASDAVFWGTTSEVLRDTPEAIAAYFDGLRNRPNARVGIGERRVRVLGETAIASGVYVFTDLVDGQPVRRPSRFSFVYRLDDGEWDIVDHHSSRMPVQ